MDYKQASSGGEPPLLFVPAMKLKLAFPPQGCNVFIFAEHLEQLRSEGSQVLQPHVPALGCSPQRAGECQRPDVGSSSVIA